jgi:Niemann-Pick C1 protein
MTQILPFIMFGIGLDDAFIISGEFGRTDPKKNPVERIDETIEAVGLSVSLTTITSVLAFGLGCTSTIPAVYWLCLYAFPTLFINFLYQLTFFVALIVIDEKRIQDNRKDCCVCFSASSDMDEQNSIEKSEKQMPLADRIMLWYADKLLRPSVKVLVLAVFSAMLAGFAYSASLLTQEFNFTDILPSDSYITEFFDAFDTLYARGSTAPYVYFRDVDQSNTDIQQQMEGYVNDLVGINAVVEQPSFFWLRDFKSFVADTNGSLAEATFNEKLDNFLQVPAYELLYKEDILRNNNGDITVSRVKIDMPNFEIDDVKAQIDVLKDQRAVTEAQPVNKGAKDWPFFNYDGIYNIWEFYSVAVDELIFSTIIGVVAVTAVATILIPHWSAGLFTLPLVCILYIDMLGFLQVAGAHVNTVSYIALVMSIGLLVDFILHILLRFYECSGTRDEKVRETLRTMGSSILIGAISTFLGIIPLGFSTSEIFSTIFIAFIGLVILGSTHGLIFLPVVLSMVGPVESIRKSEPSELKDTSDGLQTDEQDEDSAQDDDNLATGFPVPPTEFDL